MPNINGTTINDLLAALSISGDDFIPFWNTNAESNVEPTQKITAAQFAAAVKVLADLQGKLTFDSTPTTGSTNPVTSDGIATAIQQSTAISNVAITMESGFTSSLFARKSGNVVSINGYVTANSAFTSSETKIGNVAAGARPSDTIRMPVSISGAGYNPPTGTGIMFISANGNINVVAPASNTSKVIYFSVAYIAQN